MYAYSNTSSRARSTVRAWMLLANILNSLEPSLIAHTLISTNFLSIVEQTAAEVQASRRNNTQDRDHVDQTSKDGFLEDSLSTPEDRQKASKNSSKKRKRVNDMETSVVPRKRQAVENEKLSPQNISTSLPQAPVQLFRAIDTCLRVLVQMASPTNNDLDNCSKQYIRSTLKTDSMQAARLLGHWLDAHSSKDQAIYTEIDSSSDVHRDDLMLSLSNVLYIWNASSESPTETTTSMTVCKVSN